MIYSHLHCFLIICIPCMIVHPCIRCSIMPRRFSLPMLYPPSSCSSWAAFSPTRPSCCPGAHGLWASHRLWMPWAVGQVFMQSAAMEEWAGMVPWRPLGLKGPLRRHHLSRHQHLLLIARAIVC